MSTKKLKLVPGKLYRTGDRTESCVLVSNPEIYIAIPPNSIIMYIGLPLVQPKDKCNCPTCSSCTDHHFLFEDRVIMFFDAEEFVFPLKIKG